MLHGRAQDQVVTIGGRRDGTIEAYSLVVDQDCGSYPRIGTVLPTLTMLMAPGVYGFPRVHAQARALATTTTSIGAYRGAGRPEATAALERAVDLFAAEIGLDPADVGLFTVVSCTGYVTPGLDILLARDLGMPADVQRLFVGHMGCYAAIPGLATVADAVVARGLTAVLLCVELPSLHVQPATDEAQQMVAHALFSDAATAVVLTPVAAGLEVVDTVARTDAGHHTYMTWDVTDLGFRMGLSPKVPDVLALHVRSVVEDMLAKHDLTIDDVTAWAIHPGGPRILDVCRDRLGLPESAVTASRDTLRDYGNCSSPTVLIALDEVCRRTPLSPGDTVVALAFGPGLTLYGTLLRQA